MPIFTKICGTTSPDDARLAQDAGADFLGVILNHPASPRHVSPQSARKITDSVTIPIVALSVNQSLEAILEIAEHLRPHALQLHGDESPQLVAQLKQRGFRVWKAVSGDAETLFCLAQQFTQAGAEALVVDAREVSSQGIIYGGTGHLADWSAARQLVQTGFRVVLAGGLAPENVRRAVETVKPWAVDVVSGVEAAKGVKNAEKVRDFILQAHSLDSFV